MHLKDLARIDTRLLQTTFRKIVVPDPKPEKMKVCKSVPDEERVNSGGDPQTERMNRR